MKSNYQKLVSRDSITPADSTAISMLRGIPLTERMEPYNKIKSFLTETAKSYIEERLLKNG